MESREDREMDSAQVRQEGHEEEKAASVEAGEDTDTAIHELLKAREVPRKWKAY